MAIEIGENFDPDELHNLLKDNVRNDFIKFILKDSKLDKEQLEIINEHFTHYTSCIKKLSETLKIQQVELELLRSSLEYQSKQIVVINENTISNNSLINKINNKINKATFFGFKLF